MEDKYDIAQRKIASILRDLEKSTFIPVLEVNLERMDISNSEERCELVRVKINPQPAHKRIWHGD